MKKDYKNFIKTFLLIVGLALSDVSGQVMFKKIQTTSNSNHRILFLVSGFLSYLVYALCIYNLLKTNKLATTGILHVLSHFVILGLLFIVGKFYFKENYSVKEVVGITLGVISIFILSNSPHSHGHTH